MHDKHRRRDVRIVAPRLSPEIDPVQQPDADLLDQSDSQMISFTRPGRFFKRFGFAGPARIVQINGMTPRGVVPFKRRFRKSRYKVGFFGK
jgi:hypothetical protein